MGPLSMSTSTLLLLFASTAAAATTGTGGCAPVTWEPTFTDLAGIMRMATAISMPRATFSVPRKEDLEAGDINCRFWAQTYRQVNDKSCEKMANDERISIEKFFMLNPEVERDCGNIRPYTRYCVMGFFEPLRAYDGKCGPVNNNATCIGSGHGNCCNSETWTCGGTEADCINGVCYEGDCWGHNVYTTDGSCGVQHGDRRCSGKWGNCCDLKGRCGSGEAFCGQANCQMGECDGREASQETT